MRVILLYEKTEGQPPSSCKVSDLAFSTFAAFLVPGLWACAEHRDLPWYQTGMMGPIPG